MKLSEIAKYVTEKISSENILLENYITTDNLLPDKQGRTIASNLPPQKCTLTKYAKGDVLIANIRPYLKKIWMADGEGGASNDVLVFRAKEGYDSSFVYAVLLQDSFYSWVMKAPRGSQMPRGDKNHIMNFNVSDVPGKENIGKLLSNLDRKIALNRQINTNLEALARQLYDYWFVQFDFPDANGNPYKSSGGKMTYNEKLKRHIPDGWEVKTIDDLAKVYNGATPSTTDPSNYGGNIIWITPKDLSDQQNKFIIQGDRNITEKGYNSCSTHLLPINSILMSSRAPIGLFSIAKTELCTNQGFKSFVPKSKVLNTYLYYYLLTHKSQIEQLGTGTTFKEVSRDDVLKLLVLKPTKELLSRFEEFSCSVNEKQLVLQEQISSLTRQRDELLPLLMNGQVSVK